MIAPSTTRSGPSRVRDGVHRRRRHGVRVDVDRVCGPVPSRAAATSSAVSRAACGGHTERIASERRARAATSGTRRRGRPARPAWRWPGCGRRRPRRRRPRAGAAAEPTAAPIAPGCSTPTTGRGGIAVTAPSCPMQAGTRPGWSGRGEQPLHLVAHGREHRQHARDHQHEQHQRARPSARAPRATTRPRPRCGTGSPAGRPPGTRCARGWAPATGAGRRSRSTASPTACTSMPSATAVPSQPAVPAVPPGTHSCTPQVEAGGDHQRRRPGHERVQALDRQGDADEQGAEQHRRAPRRGGEVHREAEQHRARPRCGSGPGACPCRGRGGPG